MKKKMIILIISAFILCCKKNPKMILDPIENGSISGTLMPRIAFMEVTATSEVTGKSLKIPVQDATGKFSLPNIPEGSYLLNFTTIETFDHVNILPVKVEAGKHLEVGMVIAKEKPTPGPNAHIGSTGSLTGILIPKNAVSHMYTYPTDIPGSTKSYLIPVDPATGKFEITKLPIGNYLLKTLADTRFVSMEPINVIINTGQKTDVGRVSAIVRDVADIGYTITCDVNGVGKSWALSTVYASSALTISSFSTSISPRQTGFVYLPSIILKNVDHPGTYTCSKSSENKIIYSTYKAPSTTSTRQSTDDIGSEGTVIITSVDPINRIIKGTFSANLKSGDAKIITNGVINATY